MLQIENDDWNDLIQMLRQAEIPASSNGHGSAERFKASRSSLASFHSTAAMLGLEEVEKVGIELEKYVVKEIEPASNMEAVSVFGFALNALLEELERKLKSDGSGSVRISGVLEILGLDPGPAVAPDVDISGNPAPAAADPAQQVEQKAAPAPPPETTVVKEKDQTKNLDFSRLNKIVNQLGGEFSILRDDDSTSFVLRFQAVPPSLIQVETLLSAGAPSDVFASNLTQQDERLNRILASIKEFMMALSQSDMQKSQDLLLQLADQQQNAGLYKEIGSLARDLHNSLKGFMDTMDPSLREMVEERLPDSGNRLEHILELTEKSATTTIDHVEKMQKRTSRDQGHIIKLKEVLGRLKAIGEQAEGRLSEAGGILEELHQSTTKTHDDLFVVLTAQDYQDLTGQIVMKIMTLLKDLETKLVNVIRTFGMKFDTGKKNGPLELYGPAHKAKEEALHSQDDVDALLAEFGF